mmetsp:Transcript_35485/g.59252  ORF Transcript_35485/g.59252 Transcript_35485/m.59252 type:complete len:436 (-) Transcript_35485:231-1538(-)
MQFLDLPDALILRILSLLDAVNIAKLSLNRHLRTLSNDNDIWKQIVEQETRFFVGEPCEGDAETFLRSDADTLSLENDFYGISFRELYARLVYPMRNLLGFWKGSIAPRGQLLRVQLEPRCLAGYCCVFPESFDDEIMWRRLFEVHIGKGGTEVLCCHTGLLHPATICEVQLANGALPSGGRQGTGPMWLISGLSEWIGGNLGLPGFQPQHAYVSARQTTRMVGTGAFDFKCDLKCRPNPHLLAHQNQEDKQYYEARNENRDKAMERALYQRLVVPRGRHPLQGLFLGTYGQHGLEMLSVDLDEDYRLTGTKVTGDPNVPAGQVTFQIGPSPLAVGGPLHNLFTGLESDATLRPTKFEVPWNYHCRCKEVPSVALARATGLAQIARHGHLDPAWIPAELIVFSRNEFGVLWHALRSFALFCRVTPPQYATASPAI